MFSNLSAHTQQLLIGINPKTGLVDATLRGIACSLHIKIASAFRTAYALTGSGLSQMIHFVSRGRVFEPTTGSQLFAKATEEFAKAGVLGIVGALATCAVVYAFIPKRSTPPASPSTQNASDLSSHQSRAVSPPPPSSPDKLGVQRDLTKEFDQTGDHREKGDPARQPSSQPASPPPGAPPNLAESQETRKSRSESSSSSQSSSSLQTASGSPGLPSEQPGTGSAAALVEAGQPDSAASASNYCSFKTTSSTPDAPSEEPQAQSPKPPLPSQVAVQPGGSAATSTKTEINYNIFNTGGGSNPWF